jgi:hypothetical protein
LFASPGLPLQPWRVCASSLFWSVPGTIAAQAVIPRTSKKEYPSLLLTDELVRPSRNVQDVPDRQSVL